MMEKAMYVFAGIFLGGVIVAALARMYPTFGASLLNGEGKAEAAKQHAQVNGGVPAPSQAAIDAARAQGAIDAQAAAARARGLSGVLAGSIPPRMLRLLPPPTIVGA